MVDGENGDRGKVVALHVVVEDKIEEEHVIIQFHQLMDNTALAIPLRSETVTQTNAAQTFGLWGSVKSVGKQDSAKRPAFGENARKPVKYADLYVLKHTILIKIFYVSFNKKTLLQDPWNPHTIIADNQNMFLV